MSAPCAGRLVSLALSLALATAACAARSSAEGDAAEPAPDPLDPLRKYEAERRAATDFARVAPSDRTLGPNPIALRLLDRAPSGAPRFVGALRGADAVVVLDDAAREIARAPAPASPAGLAVGAPGEVFVSGEASPAIARYVVRGASLEPAGQIELAGLHGVRDIAVGPGGVLYALDERSGSLITLRPGVAGADGRIPAARRDEPIGAGPFRVERLAHHLLVDCLLDHTLVVRRVADDGSALSDGEARIRHDGPIWGVAAAEVDGGVLVAAGGVEDHPLDRTGGSFGYIDSFVFLYRVAPGAEPRATRVAAVNVSELGVLTPKALSLEVGKDGIHVVATGYGGERRVALHFRGQGAGPLGAPEVASRQIPPGIAAMVAIGGGAFAYADPLLDAWLIERGDAVNVAPVPDPGAASRSAESRLGEALFFTSLMAPWNRSDAQLSRFTCETCHFEGYVDGRTHHTGRGEVHATTKPLLGLFNNRPHFSRALDPDLTTVANNEFRVAGALSGHDPWFALAPHDHPWLQALAVGDREQTPESLRRALMTFLMDFSHRANPAVLGRSRFTAEERAGAAVFRDRCAGCHAPVLVSDDPDTAVPFDRWEDLVLAPEGAIVWGRVGYEKTGVTPYVHPDGARVPSLRRLYKKRPYFTNGSARTLRELLERARFAPAAEIGAGSTGAPAGGAFFHDGAPDGLAALDPGAIDALLAFLDLL